MAVNGEVASGVLTLGAHLCLIMRGLLIGDENAAAFIGLLSCGVLHQHLHPGFERLDLAVLTRDHVAQFIHCPAQVGQGFFD